MSSNTSIFTRGDLSARASNTVHTGAQELVVVAGLWKRFCHLPYSTEYYVDIPFLQKTSDFICEVCIKSTFFAFRDQFYEQTEGAAVLANIYMEAFEKKALESTTLKPKCWFRCVDDTFIIWPHERNTVADFLDHINGIHPDIQFTMAVEKNAALPFLDVLVERKPDGTLGHRVYRKPTHTDRYLNAQSHHHPAQKQGIINTFIHRARIISEPRHLAEELEHLRTALRGNGYKEYLATTYLPYVKACTDKIACVLKKRNINTVFSTVRKVAAAFPKTCSNDQLLCPGVYNIACSCGKVYIGQTGRHINTRLKEHKSHLKNNNWEKSAIAQHRADIGHTVDLSEANMVVREIRFWPRLYREALEIYRNPNNFNRDSGVDLSGKALIHDILENAILLTWIVQEEQEKIGKNNKDPKSAAGKESSKSQNL
ncbi:uncharacterized protein LOC108915468 [Anoplophora glabripennis]|uniref:uncharacterized protein LOC108915468 n=1 Tax=Anoplophora glabripennis TaxID=217634 RepID=UPI0008747FE3|nr:uncharacterized protein LOC108915468 [Anoplophora glabripennis]